MKREFVGSFLFAAVAEKVHFCASKNFKPSEKAKNWVRFRYMSAKILFLVQSL